MPHPWLPLDARSDHVTFNLDAGTAFPMTIKAILETATQWRWPCTHNDFDIANLSCRQDPE